MKQHVWIVFVACVGCIPGSRPEHVYTEDEAIAAITKRRGGSVEVDENTPGRPVVGVIVSPYAGDADLVCLKAFPHLRRLKLPPEMTDVGLKEVAGLKELEELELPSDSDHGRRDEGTGRVNAIEEA